MVAAQVAEKPVPREHVDFYGAPLPDGAVARLGTERFNHGQELAGVAYSVRGKSILTVGGDGSMRVWDASSRGERFTIGGGKVHATSFACTRDGASLFTFDREGFIRKWDLTTGHEQGQWCPRDIKGFFQSMAVSPDGKILALAGLNDKTAYLWDLEKNDRKELRRFPANDQLVSGVSFSPDGQTLASCGMETAIRLWDVASGSEIKPAMAPHSAICTLVVSRADGPVITGGNDTTIRRWEPSTGRELGRIGTHRGPVHDLAISDDGRSLLSASLDGMVRLWDLVTGRERLRLVDGRLNIRTSGLCFSPDGRFASAGGKIWETATGREVAILRDEKGKEFSPWSPATVVLPAIPRD